MQRRNEKERTKFRFNILITSIYIIGIILFVQLFNLQIIHGKEYREQSNTRLAREIPLVAARGSFLDRSGNEIAGTKMGFTLELYKSQIDTNTLNTVILKMINILQKNGDSYYDNFPITINPFSFDFSSEEKAISWKKQNDIEEAKIAEEVFNDYKKKYKIETENIEDARKIMGVRYEIVQKGYSWSRAVTISKNISRESANEFSERGEEFQGVNIVIQPIRNYTMGSLAAHIIGYTGIINEEEYNKRKEQGYGQNDYIGRAGMEYVFEEYLRGKDGIKQIDMAIDGSITDEFVEKEAEAGANVVLTIDANLQRVTENALANNVQKIKNGGFAKKYDTQGGAAVVMNVKTGEILAMASYPSFEPSLFTNGISQEKLDEYNNAEVKALFNRAIQGAYAPGSIFKMVTATAGLETEVISRTERINAQGIYPYAHRPVCWIWTDYHRTHGLINISQAIEKSCNYFFYEVGRRMGIDTLERYAKSFGLGIKTGVELPGETAGVVAGKERAQKDGKEWYLSDTLSASIGQSYNNFSPLQMAKYISILTNGGKQIKPTLVKTIIKNDGTEIGKEEIEKFKNEKLGLEEQNQEDLNIKPENAKAVLEGMRSVTSDSGGTAYSVFRNFNIEVGGKTGSAEAGDNRVNAWFAGFAPFDDPEIAVVVLVENGSHGTYTAEVVRDIIAEYFGMNTNKVQENTTAIPYTESLR